jgi:hypothetical protein
MKKSQLTNDWPSVLRFLTGEAVSSEMQREAISAISRDIDEEERREAEKRIEWARISAEARAIRRGAPVADDRVAKVQGPLRAALKKWRDHKTDVPVAEREEASLSIGSMSATIVPPYEFSWRSEKSDGSADVSTEAQKDLGYLFSSVRTADNGDASAGKAWSAVGIFYKPPADGTLRFSSTPSNILSYFYTAVSNADAHTAGKVGLIVHCQIRVTHSADTRDIATRVS